MTPVQQAEMNNFVEVSVMRIDEKELLAPRRNEADTICGEFCCVSLDRRTIR